MAKHNVPIQSLIDHIKTSMDVDPWAKEMAEELLKEQEAIVPKTGHWIYKKYDDMFMCSSCEKYSIRNDYPYCHWCGAKMKQEGR